MENIKVHKQSTTFRLSITAIRLIYALSSQLGINHTAVIETAIRQLAESKGIK